MTILTAESITVGTAHGVDTGFLGTGRTRTKITLQGVGLAALATQCGCAAEAINCVFMILENAISRETEIIKFNRFGSDVYLTGLMDGAHDDVVGTYVEQTRIVYISGYSNRYFYNGGTPNIVDPETFIFLKKDETGGVTLDAGIFSDSETAEPPVDGENFSPAPQALLLDGGEF